MKTEKPKDAAAMFAEEIVNAIISAPPGELVSDVVARVLRRREVQPGVGMAATRGDRLLTPDEASQMVADMAEEMAGPLDKGCGWPDCEVCNPRQEPAAEPQTFAGLDVSDAPLARIKSITITFPEGVVTGAFGLHIDSEPV